MTHKEFVEKLAPYFSMEQIEALENYGYEDAIRMMKENDVVLTEEEARIMGRLDVCDSLLEIEDIETINTMLPDKHPMDVGKFIDMMDAMDAYGEEW